MILYLNEFNARKKAVFAALAQADGGGRGMLVPLSFRDHPETAARVAEALARAKHRPKGVGGWFKRQLLRGTYNWSRRYFSSHPNDLAVVWNGMGGQRMAMIQGAKDAGAATLYAELAPLPGRITLDPAGVNAENAVPREAAFYRDWAAQTETSGEDWRRLGAKIVSRPSRRPDVGQRVGALPDTPFLFCPLQVPEDSQVTLFSGWCGGMDGFLTAIGTAAQALPPGWHLRVKEHPSAKTSLEPLLAPILAKGGVVLDNRSDSFAQLAASQGVVTLNSSMGLQAFFHDKPVIVLGQAFFAIPGLVTRANSQAELNRIFASPDKLAYDAGLRSAFMNWLDRVYYPRFDWPGGVADLPAFAVKLAEARARSARRG